MRNSRLFRFIVRHRISALAVGAMGAGIGFLILFW